MHTITPKIRFFTTTIITLTLFCSEPVFCVPPPNFKFFSLKTIMQQLRKKIEIVQTFNLEEQSDAQLTQQPVLVQTFNLEKQFDAQLTQQPVLSKTQVSWIDIAPQPKSTHELLQFDNKKPSLSMLGVQKLSQFTIPREFSPQAASTDAVFLKLIQPFLIKSDNGFQIKADDAASSINNFKSIVMEASSKGNKLSQEFSGYKEVIKYMNQVLQEPVGESDIALCDCKEQQQAYLPLKAIFAAMCNIVNDHNRKSLIENTAAEETEFMKEKALAIYKCCRELYNQREQKHDHAKIRQILAGALYELQPATAEQIIIKLPDFLKKSAISYYRDQFNKKSSQEQLKLVMQNLQSPVINDATTEAELKLHLQNVCCECGLDIEAQEVKQEIDKLISKNDIFSYMRDIPGIHKDVSCLRALDQFFKKHNNSNDQKKQAVATKIKKILNNCKSFDDLKGKGLFDFIEVNETMQLIQEVQLALLDTNEQGQELNKQIANTLSVINKYFDGILSTGQVKTLPYLQNALKNINQAMLAFKKNHPIDVENFFFDLDQNASDKHKLELCLRMHKQAKLIVFDNDLMMTEFLKSAYLESGEFRPNQLQVNRILLHAILKPFHDWSQKFTCVFERLMECLEQNTYSFLVCIDGISTKSHQELEKFLQEQLNHTRMRTLDRHKDRCVYLFDSETQTFQYVYMADGKIKTKNQVETIVINPGIRPWSLIDEIGGMSAKNLCLQLSSKNIQTIIKKTNHTPGFKYFSERLELGQPLYPAKILRALDSQHPLVDAMNIDEQPSIENYLELTYLFQLLPRYKQNEIFERLNVREGIDPYHHLYKVIPDVWALQLFVSHCWATEAERLETLQQLGVFFVRSHLGAINIYGEDRPVAFLSPLFQIAPTPAGRKEIIKALGGVKEIKSYVLKTPQDINRFLRHFPDNEVEEILKALGRNYLLGKITYNENYNMGKFEQLSDCLSAQIKQQIVLNFGGIEFIKQTANDDISKFWPLKYILEDEQIKAIESLGLAYWRKMFNEYEGNSLQCLLGFVAPDNRQYVLTYMRQAVSMPCDLSSMGSLINQFTNGYQVTTSDVVRVFGEASTDIFSNGVLTARGHGADVFFDTTIAAAAPKKRLISVLESLKNELLVHIKSPSDIRTLVLHICNDDDIQVILDYLDSLDINILQMQKTIIDDGYIDIYGLPPIQRQKVVNYLNTIGCKFNEDNYPTTWTVYLSANIKSKFLTYLYEIGLKEEQIKAMICKGNIYEFKQLFSCFGCVEDRVRVINSFDREFVRKIFHNTDTLVQFLSTTNHIEIDMAVLHKLGGFDYLKQDNIIGYDTDRLMRILARFEDLNTHEKIELLCFLGLYQENYLQKVINSTDCLCNLLNWFLAYPKSRMSKPKEPLSARHLLVNGFGREYLMKQDLFSDMQSLMRVIKCLAEDDRLAFLLDILKMKSANKAFNFQTFFDQSSSDDKKLLLQIILSLPIEDIRELFQNQTSVCNGCMWFLVLEEAKECGLDYLANRIINELSPVGNKMIFEYEHIIMQIKQGVSVTHFHRLLDLLPTQEVKQQIIQEYASQIKINRIETEDMRTLGRLIGLCDGQHVQEKTLAYFNKTVLKEIIYSAYALSRVLLYTMPSEQRSGTISVENIEVFVKYLGGLEYAIGMMKNAGMDWQYGSSEILTILNVLVCMFPEGSDERATLIASITDKFLQYWFSSSNSRPGLGIDILVKNWPLADKNALFSRIIKLTGTQITHEAAQEFK